MKTMYLCLCLCLPAIAGSPQDELSYKQGYALVLEQNWAETIPYFTRFVAQHPNSEWTDDAAFWICYAKGKNNQTPDESFNCYLKFVRAWPESNWSDDAYEHMVTLGEKLAEEGRPEFLVQLEQLERDDDGGHVSPDQRAMLQILSSLGDIGDEQAVTTILGHLDNQDPIFRARVVRILEDVDDHRVVKRLLTLVEKDPIERVRVMALEALAEREQMPEVDRMLLAVAKDENKSVQMRITAFEGLVERNLPGVGELLAKIATTSTNRDMRMMAIGALGELEAETAVTTLLSLFKSETDEEFKAEILDALAETEKPQALNFIREMALSNNDDELTREAIELMVDQEEEQVLPLLRKILDGKAPWRNKAVAVYAAGDIETSSARSLLLEVIDANHPTSVKIAAIEAMGRWEDHKGMVKILTDIYRKYKEPALQEAAVEALGDLGSSEARDALLTILKERTKKMGKE